MTGSAASSAHDVELSIPPSQEYLDLARMVVTTTAALDPLFPENRVSDLRLAVSEACTNAIEAHRRLERTEPITIHCRLTDERIEVTVRDKGGGFSPDDRTQLPDPTDPARLDHERGLGVDLIRAVADESEFRQADGGTVVRLVVHTRNPAHQQ
ncbi:MAG: ATP-binding protein [Actinomycetota bacterium]